MNYICMGVATSYGVGRHAYCLTTNNLVSAAKWNFTADPFGIMAVVVPKLAVVALLNSLVSAFKKKGIYFLWFCVISNIIFSIVAAIVLFAQCDPPSSLWNVAIPHKCWKPRIVADYSMFCGAWSAFNDLILALYPISLFYNLQMALWKRIAVCGLLGLGVFAFCCAVIRTEKLAALQNYSDVTWALSETLIWAGRVPKQTSLSFVPAFLRSYHSYDRSQVAGIISLNELVVHLNGLSRTRSHYET